MQTIQRVLRIQRHIGAASLENRQQADDHFQRTLQRQPHPHLRADPTFTQRPGQTIGPGIEFGVAQGLPGEGQRRRVFARQCLFGKQMMDALVETMFARLDAKAVEQVLLLGVVEQRQFAEALLRISDQRFKQVAPMPGHAFDGRFVEQIGAVSQAAAEAMVEVGDFQIEVELGRPRIVGQILDSHPSEGAALLEFPALHVAHHLEQRVVGRTAWRLQGFDQMIERQILMGLAFDHGVAHLLEQFADRHLPVELATQHLGVEERPDQPFAFRADAVGHRRADAQVGLAAVAVEQCGERGGHGHEQGQAVLRIERPHPRSEIVAQIETEQLALMALYRRTGTVAGQFQQRMFATELRGPVIELALALAGLQPLTLPDAVVEVLHRQRLER